jgi:HK97 family phage major capsid protein
MNLYQLKMALKTVGDELAQTEKEISAKAADPNQPISELKSLKETKANLKERFDVLKNQHDELEAAQKDALEAKGKQTIQSMTDPKDKMVAAKAEFFRASVYGKPLSDEAKAALIAIPKGNQSGGDKFLPTTMTKDLVHEPFAKNQLRNVARLTNIKGLEIPRISYELDDDDFITDEQTAKEMELKGDTVSFGRNKFKVKAKISDTVLHGSDLELVTFIENALRSGLAAKEKKDALKVEPSNALKHMSFYNGDIKSVKGADLYRAIKAAIADLHEDYRDNAKIVMRYADYLDIIEHLSNGTTNFYDAPPESVLGKPTEFADSAVKPIIGDFNYFGINYDGALVYDSDKDVDSGEYIFVLTAWYDQQRSLDSAFRIAEVEVEETP